jgi:hypothetical protein
MISNYRLLDGSDQNEIDEIIKLKVSLNKGDIRSDKVVISLLVPVSYYSHRDYF